MVKRQKRQLSSALGLALGLLVGCSLVVDTSDIDANCGANYKLCHGRCVLRSDPAFGCQTGICSPCELPNAVPRCAENKCEVAECLFGFGCPDCHAYVLADEANCGSCGNECPTGQLCADGECVAPR